MDKATKYFLVFILGVALGYCWHMLQMRDHVSAIETSLADSWEEVIATKAQVISLRDRLGACEGRIVAMMQQKTPKKGWSVNKRK